MKYVFVTLLVALLVKDVAPLGDKYILRGVSEGLALAVGLGWLVTCEFHRFAKRYMLVLLYLVTLTLTALVSQRPFFVILQVMSLASVTLFFIAYAEASAFDCNSLRRNLLAVAIGFAIVCVASLALLVSRPHLAFEVTPEGSRFKGLFNEPAMMGAVSGLLVGLAAFGRLNWAIRIIGAVAAVPCLYLTGSRTSWGAAAAALLITGIIYIKRKRSWTIALALIGVIGGLGLVVADIHVTSETQTRVIRSGSIGTLSGRTVLWELALEKYQDNPILGFGFTTGSDALRSDMGDTLSTAFGVAGRSEQQAFSLHSGYIQALLDSGAIGVSLYLAILAYALWRLFRYDRERRYGAEMYGLLFFSFSNVADTIIFGAAVFYEVFYWYLAVVALGAVSHAQEGLEESFGRLHYEQGATTQSLPDFSLKASHLPMPDRNRRFPLLQDQSEVSL